MLARSKIKGRWVQRGQLRLILLIVFSIFATGSANSNAQIVQSDRESVLDATEIVWKMVAMNGTRAWLLKYFTALRNYHLEVHRSHRSLTADMRVRVTYHAGSGKTFQIVDESGSHLLVNQVLKRLLETERQESRQRKAALTPFNYKFTFERETNEDGHRLYIFSVEPKRRNKLLYQGKVWIDAMDYAVVRIEALPKENPSLWIKNTEIHHAYKKDGDFWLPEFSKSESNLRLGGSAVLTIEYGTYQFDEPHGTTSGGAAELAAHQPPPDGR